MNILPISDIHGKWEVFDYIKKNFKKGDFDFLTISGDIWEGRSTNGRYKVLELQDKFRCPIVMCQGNHCFWDNNIFKADKDVHLLHNESITIDGVVFYGSPHTTPFMSWNWMQTEDNLYNIWNSTMPDRIDVALTHSPVFGYCDNVLQSSYGNNENTHLGSKSLDKMLYERDIKYLIHGHIHSSERHRIHPTGTKIYNVSVLDEEYQYMRFNPAPKIMKLKL